MNDIFKLAGTTVLLSSAIAITGCSSDDDSSSGVSVPKNAVAITSSAVAEATATTALETTELLLDKDSSATPTPQDVFNRLHNMAKKDRKGSGIALTAGFTENYLEVFDCTSDSLLPEAAAGTPNTYTDKGTYTEKDDFSGSDKGTTTLVSCDIGFGATADGKFSYSYKWDASADYSGSESGSVTLTNAPGTIALKNYSFKETGNDITGGYVTTVMQYVYDPSIGGGFAVETTTDLIGNFFDCGPTRGVILVSGADKTHVRATFNSDQSMTVEYDDGNGTFVETDNSPVACF